MRKWFKIIINLSIIFFLYEILFSFDLEKEYDRLGTIKMSSDIKKEIEQSTRNKSIDEIIDYCVDLTAKKLQFSSKSQIINLDNDLSKTHCVGYAKTCSTLCNYAFHVNKIEATSTPVVGQVYLKYLGLNICEFLSGLGKMLDMNDFSKFTKDHDFVEIQTEENIIYVDACAYDLIFDDLKKVVKRK